MARTDRKQIEIRDEGIPLVDDIDSLDFVGAGVTGTAIGNDVTEEIPGGSGSGHPYVLVAGDTMEGALIADDHEATGLIPQVINVTYGTADSIDMTGMPIGTFYFKHEA
jgi:hypothetical protein